jgi:hypothetical protein
MPDWTMLETQGTNGLHDASRELFGHAVIIVRPPQPPPR